MINCLNCTKPRLIETDTGHTHCSMTCDEYNAYKDKLSAYKQNSTSRHRKMLLSLDMTVCLTTLGGIMYNTKENETVDHPTHYNTGKYEAIDVIEDWQLGFNLGNAIKYISRAEHKGNKVEDLKKAIWYINREINRGKK